jgi:3-methylfumaryl-CoA hydratase
VKHGRSGPLVFVAVVHRICGAYGSLAIEERHDIVYRGRSEPAPGDRSPSPAPRAEVVPGEPRRRRTIVPDPVLLFRYSALTFNGHRIHYDQPYATREEGYPGLVVHGPLIATLSLDFVRRERPTARIVSYTYRNLRPLFDTAPFTLNLVSDSADETRYRVWASDADGEPATSSLATLDVS